MLNFSSAISERIFDPVIEGFVDSIFGSFNQSLSQLGTSLGNLIQNILGGLLSGIGGAVGGVFGFIGDILGFQDGGIVPGPIGQAQLAVVHGGETVLPVGHREFGTTYIINYNIEATLPEYVTAQIEASTPAIYSAIRSIDYESGRR